MKNYFFYILHIFQREWILFYRRRAECFNPLLFFLLIIILFPLATTSDPKILQTIGSGVIWMAMLLAVLLSMSYLFREDYQDGSLEQLILTPCPLPLLILAKIIAQWLVLTAPMIVISPIIALMFHLDGEISWILLFSLTLGTLLFHFLGAIVAALTVSLRNSGLLMALILLPLFVPIIIFSASMIPQMEHHLSIKTNFIWLSALLILAITWSPLIISSTLKIGIYHDRSI